MKPGLPRHNRVFCADIDSDLCNLWLIKKARHWLNTCWKKMGISDCCDQLLFEGSLFYYGKVIINLGRLSISDNIVSILLSFYI